MINPLKANNNNNNTANNQVYPALSQFQPQQQGNFNQIFNPNKNEFSPLMNIQQQQQQQMRFQMFNPQNMSHCKSYSLPANFQDANQQFLISTNIPQKMQPPPPRSISSNGDIPLPNGWEMEKTPTGQAYYINHITKTTSWEDPRKLLNLPQNQIDISSDTRAIINSIPLPNGWEEARTITNEIYYINHSTKTTQWEDPRITIYMQQQQQQLQQQQQQQKQFNNNYESNRLLNSSSTSSICSVSSSPSCSFSSSNSSLNDIKKYEINSKRDIIKKNLDELIGHKNSIIQQIEELYQQEMNIKSKLSQQDIEQVLKYLNTNSTNNSNTNLKTISQHFNKENIIISNQTNGNFDQNSFDNVNTSMNSDNNDMDTTLVTDN